MMSSISASTLEDSIASGKDFPSWFSTQLSENFLEMELPMLCSAYNSSSEEGHLVFMSGSEKREAGMLVRAELQLPLTTTSATKLRPGSSLTLSFPVPSWYQADDAPEPNEEQAALFAQQVTASLEPKDQENPSPSAALLSNLLGKLREECKGMVEMGALSLMSLFSGTAQQLKTEFEEELSAAAAAASKPPPPTTTTSPGVKKAKNSCTSTTSRPVASTTTSTTSGTGSPTSPEAPRQTSSSSNTTATTTSKSAAGNNQKKLRAQSGKEYKRDPRPHHNIVFCGHVDAGKSTISGHLLVALKVVDEREVEKNKREAQQHNRETWAIAFTMDALEEEKAKGKTHETGSAYFETPMKRITILDAPGHKAFVPSMIGGAAQADVAVLVISARTNEFEAGFENGGQTREHAMLVRACGVKKMICVINKMDEQNWDEERYNDIKSKLEPFLRQNGYSEKGSCPNLSFMPLSGFDGTNLIHRCGGDGTTTDADVVAPWYRGPSLLEAIDDLNLEPTGSSSGGSLGDNDNDDDDLVFPVAGATKDEGKVFVYGKVELGSICVSDRVTLLPIRQELTVEGIQIEGNPIEKAYQGDNVQLIVRGMDDAGLIHAGYVIVMEPSPLRPVDYFKARIIVLEVKNLLSNGSRLMMNLGVAEQEVSIHKILAKLDPKSQEVKMIEKEPSHVRARESFMARIELNQPMVVEEYKKFDGKLGRFMLREDGRTVAIGLITQLYESTKEQVANGTAPTRSSK